MVLPTLLVLGVVLGLALYGYLARRSSSRAMWQSAVAIGVAVGLTRAVLASLGWYTVERTGGPLQIPAFLCAMLALPEAVVLGRHRGPASLTFLVALGLLLTLSSLACVCAVALVVKLTRGRR